MSGAAIAIDDVTAADTIRSVKHRVFAVNRKLPVHRQRLVYRPGPRGMDALADDETLGGAGVAQDGTAELDVLIADPTEADVAELGAKLLESASMGRASEIIELLGEGAGIDYRDFNNSSALILAAAKGHVECVRLLIDAGADLNAKDAVVCFIVVSLIRDRVFLHIID
jgi:hypothetical protein